MKILIKLGRRSLMSRKLFFRLYLKKPKLSPLFTAWVDVGLSRCESSLSTFFPVSTERDFTVVFFYVDHFMKMQKGKEERCRGNANPVLSKNLDHKSHKSPWRPSQENKQGEIRRNQVVVVVTHRRLLSRFPSQGSWFSSR